MNYKYYIGIDPGQNTAIARWNAYEKKLDTVNTFNFWDAITALELWFKDPEHKINTLVVLEDCTQNKVTFGRDQMNKYTLDKKAQCVGMVKRDTKLLLEWCQYNDIDYIGLRPYKQKKKKRFVESFWPKRMNEHEIDACELIIGRN